MGVPEEILELEREGWEALADGSGSEYYRDHMQPIGVMVLPMGVLDHEAVVSSLAHVPGWERYTLEDAEVLELADDAALVTYRATARRPGDTDDYHALMASAYTRDEDGWKIAFHQQTPLP